MTALKNSMWIGSKADWVIVCDIDELVYHPDMRDFLAAKCDWTVLQPFGWNMWSAKFPSTSKQLWQEVQFGFRDYLFDKLTVFNPQAVKTINYTPGGHTACPVGDVRLYRNPQLKILHCKHLGWEYLTKRYKLLDAAATADKKRGWAVHYTNPPNKEEFIAKLKTAKRVVFPAKKKFIVRSKLIQEDVLLA